MRFRSLKIVLQVTITMIVPISISILDFTFFGRKMGAQEVVVQKVVPEVVELLKLLELNLILTIKAESSNFRKNARHDKNC